MKPETKHEVCYVLATAFARKGGWSLDTQFAEIVGAPYLLAHGLGIPVADSETAVTLPAAGVWRVWVYTRNWVPDAAQAPGRFQVLINGRPLEKLFGDAPDRWGWVDGGTVDVADARVRVALRDLTGFDGRCAALAFSACGDARPPDALHEMGGKCPLESQGAGKHGDQPPRNFDLVVVGGGIAGTCAALAAARQGLSVALLHDRPVLGGNASQEVRVWCGGEARHPLVREVRNRFMNREPGAALSDRERMRLVRDEPTLTLLAGWRACGAIMAADGSRIEAVEARQVETGVQGRFAAPLFVDATGDGWLGYWSGADYRMGREAADEFGESMAPAIADKMTLGSTLMWTSMEANDDMPFGPLEWAEPAAQGIAATQGEWNWEYGLDRDMIAEAEEIRDHLLRVIYGSFSLAKRDRANARRALDFVPFNLGKRESRRLMGDVILTENDVRERREFPDAVATGTWSIDLHDKSGEADFLTVCRQPLFGRYWIPFRALYSRNIENLMMAGRCFSATHVGLGSARVMNTTGQMGVAVGCAAAVCKDRGILPQQLARDAAAVSALQGLIGGGFPGHADPARAGWLVIDESDSAHVTVSGEWHKGLHENGGHYGEGFLYCANGGPESWIEYALPIEEPGVYRLRMLWNHYWDGRASAVPVRVTHAAGDVYVTVDMRLGSGLWHVLGDFKFTPGKPATVRIGTAGVDGIVVADAVAVEKCVS